MKCKNTAIPLHIQFQTTLSEITEIPEFIL